MLIFFIIVDFLTVKNNPPYVINVVNVKLINKTQINEYQIGRRIDIENATRIGMKILTIHNEDPLKWFFIISKNIFAVESRKASVPCFFSVCSIYFLLSGVKKFDFIFSILWYFNIN